jgi:hypothetical protein
MLVFTVDGASAKLGLDRSWATRLYVQVCRDCYQILLELDGGLLTGQSVERQSRHLQSAGNWNFRGLSKSPYPMDGDDISSLTV